MTTAGKVCLWLSVVGLAVIGVYLLPAVGRSHNLVAKQLRDTSIDLAAKQEQQRKAELQLLKGRSKLYRAQIGWDKFWDVLPGPNSGVSVQADALSVTGLGSETGLRMLQDEEGQDVPPSIHAFKGLPDGGAYYLGEFVATQIDAQSCTLVPTWVATPEEQDFWTQGNDLPWRFRTQVPPAQRLKIDKMNYQLQRLRELYADLESKITIEQEQLRQAEQQLLVRRQELLGDPQAEEIPGQPELSKGLVKAIRDQEDHQNNLQMNIDQLRRQIREAVQQRDAAVRRMQETAERQADSDSSQITTRAVDVK